MARQVQSNQAKALQNQLAAAAASKTLQNQLTNAVTAKGVATNQLVLSRNKQIITPIMGKNNETSILTGLKK